MRQKETKPQEKEREVKLEQQVCSLELAKKLKEIGVKQESACKWMYDADGAWVAFIGDSGVLPARNFKEPDLYCAAFTVAELGEMLPDGSRSYRGYDGNFEWHCELKQKGYTQKSGDFETEADARAKMLIYLIEKGIVKP